MRMPSATSTVIPTSISVLRLTRLPCSRSPAAPRTATRAIVSGLPAGKLVHGSGVRAVGPGTGLSGVVGILLHRLDRALAGTLDELPDDRDRKSTRLNSSHP